MTGLRSVYHRLSSRGRASAGCGNQDARSRNKPLPGPAVRSSPRRHRRPGCSIVRLRTPGWCTSASSTQSRRDWLLRFECTTPNGAPTSAPRRRRLP